MKIKIEVVRDYELYIKRETSKLNISNKRKAEIRKLLVNAFCDGIAFNQDNLEVEIED